MCRRALKKSLGSRKGNATEMFKTGKVIYFHTFVYVLARISNLNFLELSEAKDFF